MDRDAWDARYRQAGLLWSAAPNRFVAGALADLAPGRALDLACGEGRNALWLAENGWRVTAVDFSPVALAKGRAAAEPRGMDIAWIEADALAYEPEPAAYDAVLVAYLHLPADDLRAVLRKAVTAVAPGGTLLVVGHDATNPDEGTGGPQDPSVLYTAETVAAHLAPLRVESARREYRPVEGASRPAIDTLVIAVRR
jgi:SAM-dependent methyltransferase